MKNTPKTKLAKFEISFRKYFLLKELSLGFEFFKLNLYNCILTLISTLSQIDFQKVRQIELMLNHNRSVNLFKGLYAHPA